MKRTIKYKNLISLIAVLILLFTVVVTPAYASVNPKWNQFKALLASALTAINITVQSTNAPYKDALEYLADPYNVVYTYPEQQVDQFLDRSVIQIWDGYTTIDGVEYSDIWLSHDAAEKFRVNAYDLRSAYNIASNSNGTFVTGAGTLDGIPIFQGADNKYHSQIYQVTYTPNNSYVIGNGITSITTGANPSNARLYHTYSDGQQNGAFGGPINTNQTVQWNTISTSTANNQWRILPSSAGGTSYTIPRTINFSSTPFDFDWVSGTIPADQILPADQGLMIRVPTNTPGLNDFLTDNPEFQGNNPVTIDVTIDPDINVKLDDLFGTIIPVIPLINNGDIQFTINHEAPIPPIPDVPIVDATVPQVVQPIINEIQNQGDIISQSIPPIIESIPKIDEICNNIDTAPYHDLDTGLDHLPSFFLPFITDLRSALGIWHYVTEWLAQISTTFAFVTGCLVGTSIMTPIYAAIAGFMCIKIYRRMTA